MKFVVVVEFGIILSAVANPIGIMRDWSMRIRHKNELLQAMAFSGDAEYQPQTQLQPPSGRVPFKKIPKGVHSALHGVFDLHKFYAQDQDHCLVVKAKCINDKVPCCTVEKYKDGEIYVIEQVCYTLPHQIIRPETA